MMLHDAVSRHTSSTLFPSRDPRYRPHDDVSGSTAGNRGMVWNRIISVVVIVYAIDPTSLGEEKFLVISWAVQSPSGRFCLGNYYS
jgi:hypothetical protein